MEKIPVTRIGLDRLEKELKLLQSVERPAVIEAIAEARAHGDLKENAEYAAAKDKQSFVEGRILELKAVTSRAEVIELDAITHMHISFGATVKLVDEETDAETIYQIVGDYEADINEGRISTSAPISRALIGKNIGDSVEVNSPKGLRYYEVLEIDYK
jgi:transcription elongation factor GreA